MTTWIDDQKATTQTIVLTDVSDKLYLRQQLASAKTDDGVEIDFTISGLTVLASVSDDDNYTQVAFSLKELLNLLGEAAVELHESKSL
jgi:hypothetical protein